MIERTTERIKHNKIELKEHLVFLSEYFFPFEMKPKQTLTFEWHSKKKEPQCGPH